MRRLFLLGCLSAGLAATSCKKEAEPVLIRVKNNSAYRFESAFVKAANGEKEYGAINAGEVSDYSAYQKAYGYGYVKVVVDRQELEWAPYDYVGATPLRPGKYTYVVSVENDNNQQFITLQLEKP